MLFCFISVCARRFIADKPHSLLLLADEPLVNDTRARFVENKLDPRGQILAPGENKSFLGY